MLCTFAKNCTPTIVVLQFLRAEFLSIRKEI